VKPPIEPHLAVKIGNVELTLETGAVSFETTYNVDMPFSPSAVITVYDLELEIERILLREPLTPVEVVYGWKDTEGLKIAGMWKGRAIKASSTMEGIVSTLEISCLAEGAGDLYKTDRQVRRKGKVDQIIRQIAQENRLMADVDSVDMEIDRLQVNMTDYDFIRNVLIPYVNSGDEPYLIALNKIPVVVSKSRYEAGLKALENFDVDIFILDDGFQHFQLYRDLDILLINSKKPFWKDKPLPFGRLREPVETYKYADIFVITKAKEEDKNLIHELKGFGKPFFFAKEISNSITDFI